MNLTSSRVRYGLIACLSVLLSVSGSACGFASGTAGAVDGRAPNGTTTDVNQYLGNPDASGGSAHILPMPSVEATPEADSLTLFGSGLLAAAAYIGRRRYLPRGN